MKLTVVTVFKMSSDEHKRSVRNCDCEKNEIAKHSWKVDHNFSWNQNKVVDRENRLIPRKIKETIHSLKNPNQINKIPGLVVKLLDSKSRVSCSKPPGDSKVGSTLHPSEVDKVSTRNFWELISKK